MISTSFFVTNFPDELGWGDLWKLFGQFGSVSDVFIPKKMDKWGRRFGFVNFKGVQNVEELSNKLEDVWWNSFKLRVNRARFAKGDKEIGEQAGQKQSQRPLVGSDRRVNGEISFKSLLLREGGASIDKDGMVVSADGDRKKTRVLNMGDIVPLDLHVHENSLKLLRCSMVGIFKETMDYQSFSDRLLVEGQHEVKAVFMGGNMVLLQSPCEGELEEVMRFNKVWWDHCFSKIIPWKPNILSECRDIWIQIYGIPLHAWEENSFKKIAGRFGVFLDFDEATIAKHRLDVARVKLRTVRRGIIDTVLQLKVQGEFFDVWVVEERCCHGEEGSYSEVDGRRSLEITNCNSGEHGWKGDDRDVFEDGSNDSDGSNTYKTLLGLQEVGKRQTVAVAGDKEGIGNIDPQSQYFMDGNVGVIESEAPIDVGHVEEEGEDTTQIPSDVILANGNYLRGSDVGPEGELSNTRIQDGESSPSHVSDSNQLLENNAVGPIGPSVSNWNPFLDEEDQEDEALSPNPVNNFQIDKEGVLRIEEVPLVGADVDGGVGNDNMRLSQLSESSDSSQEMGGLIKKRSLKKGHNNSARPCPPMLGVPKFRQLELTLKATGKRRKEGGRSCSNSDDTQPNLIHDMANQFPQQGGEQHTGIELHVELPFCNSGLNHLLDNDGGFVPELSLENEVNDVIKNKEVKTLIAIQKEVGFNFEATEEEVQEKLVELDNFDREKIAELVLERGN
ncbi:zinc finger CCCH domain-containing protein [Trifolium repens]|nr:zinc finger CCCH domain-containing protein [Trifolium repens]